MEIKEFLETYSKSVENNRGHLSNKFEDDIHMMLGVISEAGELADVFKKYMAYGKDIDWVNVKEELGDLVWYIVGFCNINGFTLDDVMETNMRKLSKRYKNGFTTEEALTRNLEIERAELELQAQFEEK